jgi:hypothetical protein
MALTDQNVDTPLSVLGGKASRTSDDFRQSVIQKEVNVFTRIVSMRLKPNSATEFSQTIEKKILPILRKHKGFRDEITLIVPGGSEAVGISFWESREHADAYNTGGYPEVMRELNKLLEERPLVKTYDVANSTAHNIAARAA